LFIDLALMASFLRGELIFFAAKFSLGKFRGALNSFCSLASGVSHRIISNRPVKRILRRLLPAWPLPAKLLTAGGPLCKGQSANFNAGAAFI
jgi:hypothetical protein